MGRNLQIYSLIDRRTIWESDKKKVRPVSSGTELDYPVCSLDEIKGHLAQATSLCQGYSVLFLWTIDKYLFEAQQIAES